jgi:hypothetical protein
MRSPPRTVALKVACRIGERDRVARGRELTGGLAVEAGDAILAVAVSVDSVGCHAELDRWWLGDKEVPAGA